MFERLMKILIAAALCVFLAFVLGARSARAQSNLWAWSYQPQDLQTFSVSLTNAPARTTNSFFVGRGYKSCALGAAAGRAFAYYGTGDVQVAVAQTPFESTWFELPPGASTIRVVSEATNGVLDYVLACQQKPSFTLRTLQTNLPAKYVTPVWVYGSISGATVSAAHGAQQQLAMQSYGWQLLSTILYVTNLPPRSTWPVAASGVLGSKAWSAAPAKADKLAVFASVETEVPK